MTTIQLSGELVIETINKQITNITKTHLQNNLTIDLTNINKIDTAGIAMLIDLQAQSHKASKQISYINIPIHVSSLCTLYQIKL